MQHVTDNPEFVYHNEKQIIGEKRGGYKCLIQGGKQIVHKHKRCSIY